MPREIEAVYQEIGELIFAKMPENWQKAVVTAERDGQGVLNLTGHYLPDNDQESINFRVGPEITRSLVEVANRLNQNDTQAWKKVSVSIEPSGEFNIDLSY